MSAKRTAFADVLRQFRIGAALSQEELAERAGLSRRGISDLERGLSLAPRLETVRLLADALALAEEDRAALLAAARPALRIGAVARSALTCAALPMPLTRLTGREVELTALLAAFHRDDVRWLTMTGAGGTGKTRLALEVAARARGRYADGVCFVDLSPLTDPAMIVPAIAATLGAPEVGTENPVETLARLLASRRLLLVLDNCERVLAAAPELVILLASSPGLTIFATSRGPFHVRGEHEFPLAPLPLPDAARPWTVDALAGNPAVALFVERTTAVQPDFALTEENAAAVAAICQRLDGLPLAIELAAARAKILPPTTLLARLDPRLPLLSGGGRDLPARQRTMRDTIAWSYDLLGPAEQTLFRRLSIFAGGFTLEAAEHVGAEGGRGIVALSPFPPFPLSPSTLDLIASLVDQSLLQRTIPPRLEPRFTMLQTVREFALEMLAANGEVETIAARHAAWYVGLAERVRRDGGLSHGIGLDLLEAEHPNLRAALTWFLECEEVTSAQHLAGELAEFWQRHGHLAEGTAWLERVLAADAGEPTAARANALIGLNMLLWDRDELTRAERLLREAVAVACAAEDVGALANARLHQGYVAAFQGDLDLAWIRGEEALTTSAAIPQGFSDHGALWLLGFVALVRREDAQAVQLNARLLASARAQGDQVSIADALFGLAVLAERRGELRSALAGYAEAATVCREFDQKAVASYFLEAAAATAVALGHVEPAARLFAAADTLRAGIGAVSVLGSQVDSDRQQQALHAARVALGATRFATAWKAGTAFSFDDALAEVTALAREMASPGDSDKRTSPP